MHEKFNLLAVQNELGYTFKDPSYIKSAFIHRSYDAKGEENNVRLVFLGGQLLNFVLCDYITSRLPYTDEKQLSYQTECYVSALGTDKYIKAHSLSRFVMMSEINEPMRESAAIGREIFSAIIAAIYRDGGLPSLKSFLMPMIRACGGDDHYRPSLQGQVLTGDYRAASGTDNHIRSERLRRPQKSGSIGFSKAETVASSAPAEEKEKPKKAEKGLSKLLSKKKKEKEEVTEEKLPAPKTEKKFIRDPFAPVKLSDDLRNFKPKKPSKYEAAPQINESETKNKTTPKNTPPNPPKSDLAAAKTLLQEYVQNNLRTASVLLKYSSEPLGNGKFKGIATLDGKVIGVSEETNAKNAERVAAQTAYLALTDNRSAEHKWFFSLSEKDVTPSDKSWDHVSKINQHFQQKMHLSCAPITYEKRPAGKKGVYCSVAIYEGKEIGRGEADNFKDAKQLAAKEACKKLGIK